MQTYVDLNNTKHFIAQGFAGIQGRRYSVRMDCTEDISVPLLPRVVRPSLFTRGSASHPRTRQLSQIRDGSSVALLLDQSMYFGMSLGRVNVDFRGLLPPIFERHVRDSERVDCPLCSLFGSDLSDVLLWHRLCGAPLH